ncbi:MAG TPA: hypothetical protein VJW73_03440, partial [Gemmatimonadaceae bacterium]|nr:hypothetical protein [Gemmatimonadaceae bacterium]
MFLSVIPSEVRDLLFSLATTLVLLLLVNPLHAVLSAQRTHLLIVSGLGGEPHYSEEFRTLGFSLFDAARK